MLLPGPNLNCAGPLALGEFRNMFVPNIGEDQKSQHQSARPLALRHIVYPSLVITISLLHYVRKKG